MKLNFIGVKIRNCFKIANLDNFISQFIIIPKKWEEDYKLRTEGKKIYYDY